jgi:hypothetical protein
MLIVLDKIKSPVFSPGFFVVSDEHMYYHHVT